MQSSLAKHGRPRMLRLANFDQRQTFSTSNFGTTSVLSLSDTRRLSLHLAYGASRRKDGDVCSCTRRRSLIHSYVSSALPSLPLDAAAQQTVHRCTQPQYRSHESGQLYCSFRLEDADDNVAWNRSLDFYGIVLVDGSVDHASVRTVRIRSSSNFFVASPRFSRHHGFSYYPPSGSGFDSNRTIMHYEAIKHQVGWASRQSPRLT